MRYSIHYLKQSKLYAVYDSYLGRNISTWESEEEAIENRNYNNQRVENAKEYKNHGI